MLLKKLANAALLALFGTTLWMAAPAPARAAGTTPLALAVQRDSFGNAVPGCLLYFYVAGTVATPQNAYSDFGLTSALGNPLSCDQAGRVPMHWLADGLIHIRLTTFDGTPIVDTTMQVLGPSAGGGGGGGTVDPTAIIATGDLKARYGTGVIAGFVRANGQSIGNATCGCSERANADTQALFIYLYNTDPNLTVSGGRTGNALNDFNAGKQLSLPDWRGRALAFLDDMGASAAGRLTSTYFGTSPTVLGAASSFADSRTMLVANLPPYTPAGAIGNGAITFPVAKITSSGGGSTAAIVTSPSVSSSSDITGALGPQQASSTFTGTAQGGTSTPFSVIQPTMLATIYLKL